MDNENIFINPYLELFNILFSKYNLIFILFLLSFIFLLRIYLRYKSRKNFVPFEYKGKNYQLSPKNLITIPKDGRFDPHVSIPLNNSLEQFFYISFIYNLPNAAKNLVAAYILRWIYRGNIEQIYRLTDAKGEIDITLKVMSKPKKMTPEEYILWKIVEASKVENNVIATSKFTEIVENNSRAISLWIPSVARTGAIEFYKKGLLEPDSSSKNDIIPMMLNEKGKQAIIDFFKFRNYLDNFTLLDQRSMPEVSLWDDYLVLATSLGLGKKVASQMKRIVPTFGFLQNYFVITTKNGTTAEVEFFKVTTK